MDATESVIVIAQDGEQGTLVRRVDGASDHEAYALVELGSGEQVIVPLLMLTKRDEDDAFALPLRFADLDRADLTARAEGNERVIPIVAEELTVRKREVETGKVRVRKVVREHEEIIDEPLLRESVEVKRVPIGRFVEERPATRREGDITIVPLVEEVLVVEKRLMLKEEIHLITRRTEEHEPQRVTLRSEEAVIDRIEGNETP